MSNSRGGYVNPYLSGAVLGLVLFGAFWLTGGGLGASGGINRIQLAVAQKVVPDVVDHNAYFAHTAGGSKNPLANPLVPMLAGVVLGGFLSGLAFKRVKVEVRKGPSISVRNRLILALVGGIIMGWGARMARGCTSGQGLSGGAVLSAGSWAFLMAFFAGGYAMAWFVRKTWN
ncbi:MAG: YeeE/YedE family protein [Deltaproteobacteria bacterium]|nr:YeeE/YedE family protein [Deltaproteobacteria bacterium]